MTDKSGTNRIPYPYMPAKGSIHYVSLDNPFMQAARTVALEKSLDKTMPNGSVIVRDNTVLGRGANGSTYHDLHGCERVRLHIPTGQGYELCEGCSPKNHSESKAITDALKHTKDLHGAVVYLWGHWWCCEACWNTMLTQGITMVYLLKDSAVLFNKEVAGNIVGKQFVA